MIANKLEPKQALSKAYLKLKPDHESVEVFKANLLRLRDLIDDQKEMMYQLNLSISTTSTKNKLASGRL